MARRDAARRLGRLRPGGGRARAVRGRPGHPGGIPDAQLTLALLESLTLPGAELAAIDVGTQDVCGIVVGARDPPGLAELADAIYQPLQGRETFSDIEAPMPLTLPAGPGQVLTMRYRDPDAPDWSAPQAWYLVRNGSDIPDSDILMLTCSGPESADDDWLYIADTFEFLPPEGS